MERTCTPVPYIRLDLIDSDKQSAELTRDGKLKEAGRSSTIGTINDRQPILPVRSAYWGLSATVGQDLQHYNDAGSRPQRHETSWPFSLSEWMNPSFSLSDSRPTLPSLDRSDFNSGLEMRKHAADGFEKCLPPNSTETSPNQIPPLNSQTSLLPAIDFKRPSPLLRSQSDYAVDSKRIEMTNGLPAERQMSTMSEYERTSSLRSTDQCLVDAKLVTTIPNDLGEERSKGYLSPESRRPEPIWRSQSYGEVFVCHGTSPHKTPGFLKPRYQVSYLSENGGCEPSTEEDFQRHQSNSSMHRSRSHTASNHLANMIAGRDTQGKLAQAHYETIITPPRPKVVIISGCKSPPIPLLPASPLDHPPTLVSAFDPETPTPPETPGELVVTDEPTFLQRLEACKVMQVERHDGLPATPPSTPDLSLRESLTTQVATIMQTESSRLNSSAPVSECTLEWTLHELENSLFRLPCKTLQLNSPVIQHIRNQLQGNHDPNPRRGSTGTGAKTCDSPSFDPPHSRYSILKPLSSHPVSSTMGERPTSPRTQCQRSHNTVHGSLRTIFPKASELELDSIHASQIALSYITNVLDPRSPSRSPSLRMPPKPRATLGFQSLTSHSPSETSWFRSRSSSPAIDELLRERMEFVKEGLRDALRGLLVETVQEDLEYAGETLLLAVGEVVRLGEERN